MVAVIVGLLAATVAASYIHPILAVMAGAAIGVVVAGPIAALIWIWPVLRVLWWWLPETIASVGLLAGWDELATHTTMVFRLLFTALIIGGPAAVPQVRTRVMAAAWCFASRHRLRVCFNEFIITNRTGSLPLILWARPTQVGERIWIWLRPGLCLDDLQSRLDKIAPACWADRVTAERASDTNSAYVRLDIKRRNALSATIGSPLIELVPADTPAAERTPMDVPTALDLSDVTPESVTDDPITDKRDSRKKRPATEPVTTPAATGSDDVSDWI